jgi:pimeloyl-ACP methyl ester carboxylesterase
MSDKPGVVLVHGGFADGSGWRDVYDLLAGDGYQVSVVQNPTLSLEGDALATRMILDRQQGPTILVGHSYGGAVTQDRMIPPDAQRTMSGRLGATVVEVDASHSVYISQPGAVADLIKQAAAATA